MAQEVGAGLGAGEILFKTLRWTRQENEVIPVLTHDLTIAHERVIGPDDIAKAE